MMKKMQPSPQGYKLSPQQEHIWLIRQHEADRGKSEAYDAHCSLYIEGCLAEHRLRHALEKVVQRHEILRTSFYRKPGMRMPIQVVAEQANPQWQVEDLRGQTAQQQELRIEQICTQDISE